MNIFSDDFQNSGRLADSHAYAKQNLSPSLRWENVPEQAQQLALICEDPDAPGGNWVHWVMYCIPAEEEGLPGGVPKWQTLDKIGHTKQGKNDFKKLGYDGPHPPPGSDHRYFFKLYALSKKLVMGAGMSAVQLRKEMEGAIIEEAETYGVYSRS